MDYKTLVTKSNSLTKASFSMTLDQKRIVLACIAQIADPRSEITRDDEFTVTAPYFCTLFGLELKNAYAQLKEATESLQKEVIIINNPDATDPKLSRIVTNWFSVAKYYDGEGKIIVKFNDTIIPYVSNLNKGYYTQYGISKIARLKSAYAIRLYELLICEAYHNKEYVIAVKELKTMLGLADKYTSIVEFKRRIIKPAIENIKKTTDITILEVEQRKTGREVTHLIFKYSVKKEAEKPNTKANGTKPLIPLFTGHPEYTVDSEAILEELKQLGTKPEPKPKKTLDSDKKSKITDLKRAVTHG
jgi:plasmid replication initiation protein